MTTPLIDRLTRLLTDTRARTERLVAPLTDDELHTQPIDFLSPVVWDVAHVGNFEELWLVRQLGGARLTEEEFDRLYDAFEQPRGVRGGLPLLDRYEASAYLDEVRAESLALLHRIELTPDDPLVRDGAVHRMIAQHESQHQETVVQSLLVRDGLETPLPDHAPPSAPRRVDDEARVVVPGGPFVMGTDHDPYAYDNERGAHRVEVPTFALDRYPVSCRRYAAFVADGGYRRPEWWTDRGWAWLQQTGHAAPQGWVPDLTGGWRVRRTGRDVALDPREPVQHVSWFEADAFARWDGGRLPTEAEWEKAASWDPATGTKRRFPWGDAPVTPARANVGLRRAAPDPVGSHPAGASAYGVEQLAGDVYEWTSSGFEAYPGFAAFPYREYSEVFFGGDYAVLRGSSWAIAEPIARTTYRNWDHPYRRQVLAGIRVARDVPATRGA
ncbi:ergothioneine biosynthesis protein EgtB [Nitriliruptor alkaliphilus]|uniref:ergothioneine biosynthesis protein EgtB n=1 Tax=Nitriliruptor alkaliphilus TaxID=427918 RepID=UPI0006966FCC|nr:ergothioneine biosynthesis protein EgtB [Nitriliruptor alkaliphilus]